MALKTSKISVSKRSSSTTDSKGSKKESKAIKEEKQRKPSISLMNIAMYSFGGLGLLFVLIGVIVFFAKVRKDSSQKTAKDACFVITIIGGIFIMISTAMATLHFSKDKKTE